MAKRTPITADAFDKAARLAEPGQLKRREGKYGAAFSLWVNRTMVMLSEVDSEGERHYWRLVSVGRIVRAGVTARYL